MSKRSRHLHSLGVVTGKSRGYALAMGAGRVRRVLLRGALVLAALGCLVAPGIGAASGATRAAPLGIKGRVLKDGEFTGFTAKAPAVVVINLDDWVKIAPSGGINVSDRL